MDLRTLQTSKTVKAYDLKNCVTVESKNKETHDIVTTHVGRPNVSHS